MTTHELKCWQPFFNDIKSGLKTFEIRYNDRNYQVGDYLILNEYNPKTEIYGDSIKCEITWILTDPNFVSLLKEGYIVMSIKVVEDV